MCFFVENKIKYGQCTAKPKHINTVRSTDSSGCEEFKKAGFKCDDEAIRAKDKGGTSILFGSTTIGQIDLLPIMIITYLRFPYRRSLRPGTRLAST